jgi:hypothetical protein
MGDMRRLDHIRERDLGGLLGLTVREVRELAACLVPLRGRGEARIYRWRDVQPFLTPEQIKQIRRIAHNRRTRSFGSKYCVAGYPRLLAEWHPTANGDLSPYDVSFGSQRFIWWVCPRGPDHAWRSKARTRVRGSGCPCCTGKKVSVTNRLADVAPEVAAEWHARLNGKRTPRNVVVGSKFKAWWRCPAARDHVWAAFVVDRTVAGSGCPFCAGRRVSSTNRLSETHPEVARLWHPTRNGRLTPDEVAACTARRVWWRCPDDPQHVWCAAVKSSRRREGTLSLLPQQASRSAPNTRSAKAVHRS